MAFWTDTSAIQDPKRKFRFLVQFTNITEDGGNAWWAKTINKPSFQISSAEHKYLNHTFFYPGSVTWQDISVTLVDPVSPDMSATFSDLIEASGYSIPTGTEDADLGTLSKGLSVGALGDVIIRQVDAAGSDTDAWTLRNAWISEVKYGDLEYGSDDLLELTLTLKYDWATLDTIGASSATGDKATQGTSFFSTTGEATTE